jgi:ADP-ribose pyrophosphatase YjhB (NUDIX family)
MTLGVRAMVVDAEKRILLVRQSYSPGWVLPGGGVERGETAIQSLRRELDEEAAVTISSSEPQLFGLYSNESRLRGDHVAFYIVREFVMGEFVPTVEIREARLFAVDDLPADTAASVTRRIAEIEGKAPRSPYW